MTDVDDKAFLSGVLHGVEVAVRGGLITPAEVEAHISEVIRRSFDMVEGWEEISPTAALGEESRQVFMGELIGTVVAARIAEGDLDGLSPEDLRNDYVSVNGKIDHYGW